MLMTKIPFITYITEQDYSYLHKYLLKIYMRNPSIISQLSL